LRRIASILVRNWPLKLLAVVVALLLYTAFVLAGNVRTYQGTIPITAINQPADAVLVGELPTVSDIRYVAPPEVADRVGRDSFIATVDLAGAEPTPENPFVTERVRVEAVDPRIQIIDFTPQVIQVQLDPLLEKQVPVRIEWGEVPAGLSVGVPELSSDTVTVTGAASVVQGVVAALGRVVVQPTAIDIDQDVPLVAIDSIGETVTRVRIDPPSIHVRIPVISDAQSKSLPVNAVIVGVPATGQAVSSVTVEPAAVTVSGDADVLAALTRVDTQPVPIAGAQGDVTRTVELDLPAGVTAIGNETVRVTVAIVPLTETRTYSAGIVLNGAAEDRTYALSTDRVSVVLGGTVGALDALDAASFTVFVDVGGLSAGVHEVPVQATLPAGITMVSASPSSVSVTVAEAVPSAGPSPAASPSAGA
jgi:YbbR domain-containing protein